MVIVVASPLTEDIYRRIGVDELSRYFEIIVADCLSWLVSSDRHPDFSEKHSDKIRKVNSRQEFEGLMQRASPHFVLDFAGRGSYTKTLQTECRKVKAQYITHHLIPDASGDTSVKLWGNLWSNSKQLVLNLTRYVGRRLAIQYPYPPDVSLLAGRKSESPWLMSANKVIKTATPGYFELQNVRQDWANHVPEGEWVEKGYILFIDDCLTLSFDFHLGHHPQIIDHRSYFDLLNGFFDRLESLTGLPVVVAAHPNAREYDNYQTFFNGRRVYYGKTAALSCGCVCALTHYSSAINFPVMLRKPIALLTFDRLQASAQGRFVNTIASSLQRPTFDLSKWDNDVAILAKLSSPADEASYATYVSDYILDTSAPGADSFENLAVYLASQSTT